MASGSGHAASVVTCKYSPCGKYLISGSSDGAVIIWKIPQVILLGIKFDSQEIEYENKFAEILANARC